MVEYCKELVGHERALVSHCSRKACKDGYCKQHHPESKAKRDQKRKKKWVIEDRLWNIRSELRSLRSECVDLVIVLAGENKKAARIAKKMNTLESEFEAEGKRLEKYK